MLAFTQNKYKLEGILNEYIEKEILNDNFYYDGVYSDELYGIYYDVDQFNGYYMEEAIYDCQDQVGVEYHYCSKPYQIINDINSQISWMEISDNYNYDEIESLKEQLSYFESKVIYNEFLVIQQRISMFLEHDFELYESIKFLHSKLEKFNSLQEEKKDKYLHKFCKLILDEENIFTVSLNNFRRLNTLKEKLDSKNRHTKLKLDFSLWESIDVDLLAVYDAETYLALEELYLKLSNLEINVNMEDSVKDVHKLLVTELEPLIVKEEKILKKTLTKTNRLFNGI
jgi:hypothetical protein